MENYKPYPAYKDSGIKWLGEVPRYWSTSKLRYLFTFAKGLNITKENLKYDGIPCVNYGEVHSKYGFEVDINKHHLKCVDESYLNSSPNALLKMGDLVFADTSEDIEGSGNFTQLTSEHAVFAGYHTIIARPKNRQSSRFYAYLFDSQEFRTQIRYAVKGVKVFSITQAILRGIDIWLPTIEEKTKIANFLDYETARIDKLIEKQQQLIKLLKEKRQAVICHAVTKGLNPDAPMKDSGVKWLGEVPAGWCVCRLKHIKGKNKNAFVDGPFGSNLKSEHFVDNGDVYVIESNFATTGSLIYSKLKTISATHFSTISRSETKEGDIILAKIGARYGMNSVMPTLDKKAVVSGNSLSLTVDDERMNVHYCHHLLTHLKLEDAMDEGVNVTAQPALSLGQLNNLPFLHLPLEEQDEIVCFIKEQEEYFLSLITNYEKMIKLSKERRTALISAAVTGKIDVRHWQSPKHAKTYTIEKKQTVVAV